MIVDLLIPALVVLLMVSAGTGVKLGQFVMLLRLPGVLLGGTLLQLLVLPLAALLLVRLTAPVPALAAGLILVAACPGGALSNVYCYLGRLNVSLSVMLTTLSTLLSFAALPLVLALALPMLGPDTAITVPVGDMALRLVLFLLLPVAVGIAIRRFVPGLVERHGERVRTTGLVLLVALLGLIVFDQWDTLVATYRSALLLGSLFTLVAAAAGWAGGAVLGVDAGDRWVFAIEFAIRNLGAAALIASASLGRSDFLAFGAVFVVVQLPLALLFLGWRRARGLLAAT